MSVVQKQYHGPTEKKKRKRSAGSHKPSKIKRNVTPDSKCTSPAKVENVSTRPVLPWLPVPKKVDSVTKLLTHLGTKSIKLGPGEQYKEQRMSMAGKHKLSITFDSSERPTLRRIQQVVIHEISCKQGGDRTGSVTLYMSDGGPIQCGWTEKSDGTVGVRHVLVPHEEGQSSSMNTTQKACRDDQDIDREAGKRTCKKKKQKTKRNESLVQLVQAFDEADNDGETFAMAQTWKEMKDLGFDPNRELKMELRIANGCDNLKTRVREMMQLLKILE